MSTFSIEDCLAVPPELAANHNTLISQSILVLAPTCSEENQLIRLLLGTANLVHDDSGLRIKQRTNYSVSGRPITRIRSPSGLPALLIPYELTVSDLDLYFRRSLRQRVFYGELLYEICHSLWRTKKGDHTMAFLHLYRFLEHIALAFPLLYAARTADYDGAFNSLKDFFSGDGKGELGFLKKSINVSVERTVLNATETFDLQTIPEPFREEISKIIADQVDERFLISRTNEEVQIKTQNIIDICVGLRNRYFHFLATNKQNISVRRIGNSDMLFDSVNPAILNFLSICYFETLRNRVSSR